MDVRRVWECFWSPATRIASPLGRARMVDPRCSAATRAYSSRIAADLQHRDGWRRPRETPAQRARTSFGIHTMTAVPRARSDTLGRDDGLGTIEQCEGDANGAYHLSDVTELCHRSGVARVAL